MKVQQLNNHPHYQLEQGTEVKEGDLFWDPRAPEYPSKTAYHTSQPAISPYYWRQAKMINGAPYRELEDTEILQEGDMYHSDVQKTFLPAKNYKNPTDALQYYRPLNQSEEEEEEEEPQPKNQIQTKARTTYTHTLTNPCCKELEASIPEGTATFEIITGSNGQQSTTMSIPLENGRKLHPTHCPFCGERINPSCK